MQWVTDLRPPLLLGVGLQLGLGNGQLIVLLSIGARVEFSNAFCSASTGGGAEVDRTQPVPLLVSILCVDTQTTSQYL